MKKNTTTTMASLSITLLPLLFCLLLSPSQSAQASPHLPGFLYTRNRGTCTPQFWSGRKETWPRMVPETSTVSNVFGWRVYKRYRSDLTLLEATTRNDEVDNPFGALLKEGTTALINSYARQGFPYKPWQVKTLVMQGFVSEVAAASQAKHFSLANHACS
ncbi:hypothetical protein MtrunA17_Chr7g0261311 [Medicago truncatula]|uniref:Pollen Ole e I family allergen n=2 Tax=Medicago truncatula TaxID=3880 RepID=A0A396H4L1_MEDTR|nr:uncharacterized protein LOC25499263 [Medicago truncatula]RHN48209.1 hypothetical protein MtrunA17_Chr7g0261311 [Medicago truncatula]